MTDRVGTTSYGYYDIPDGSSGSPGLGARRLHTVDGPWSNDTIAYEYDELGRVVSRSINTTANEIDLVYDALGRVE